MNKKVYTIILMVVLMLVIVFMKNLFLEDIQRIAISNNNIEKFNNHILREGEYSFSLPEGWEIDSINSESSHIIVTFNNKEDVYGSISILNKDVNNIYADIEGDINNSKIIKDTFEWNVITEIDGKNISEYYIRDYSEGKVLIIKFSYIEGNSKESIKAVFNYIAMSFI